MPERRPPPRHRAGSAAKGGKGKAKATPRKAAPRRSVHAATSGNVASRAKKAAPVRRRATKAAPRARSTKAAKGWRRLRVVPQADGPHVRLGLAWAVVTVLVVLLGPVPTGVWMALHAGLAVVQVERSWESPAKETLATGAAAGVFAFACAFGVVGAVVGAAIAITAPAALTANQGRGKVSTRSVAAALLVGAAAGSLALARTIGPVPGLFLLGLLCAHDTGNYIVGTGAKNAWEGTAAGMAACGPVTVLGATLAVPPLTETGPWILGALGAVAAPMGPMAGQALLGRKKGQRVPALRRLDGLIIMGPLWCAAALVFQA